VRTELEAALLERIAETAPGLADTLWGEMPIAIVADTLRYGGGWTVGYGQGVTMSARGEAVAEVWQDRTSPASIDLLPLVASLQAYPLRVVPAFDSSGRAWWWGASLDRVEERLTEQAAVSRLVFSVSGWHVDENSDPERSAEQVRLEDMLDRINPDMPAGVFAYVVPDEDAALACPTLPAVLVVGRGLEAEAPESSTGYVGQVTEHGFSVFVRAGRLDGIEGVDRLADQVVKDLAGARIGIGPMLRPLAVDSVELVDSSAGVFTREIQFSGRGVVHGRGE